MTDDQDQAQEDGAEDRDEIQIDPRTSDVFLQALVRIVNDPEGALSFPITLNVGGLVITGDLAKVSDYYDNFAAEVEEGFKFPNLSAEDAAKSATLVGDLFRSWGEDARESQREEPAPVPNYIHLRNARILLDGNFIPENRPVWWRGRITAVDGYVLGKFEG